MTHCTLLRAFRFALSCAPLSLSVPLCLSIALHKHTSRMQSLPLTEHAVIMQDAHKCAHTFVRAHDHIQNLV